MSDPVETAVRRQRQVTYAAFVPVGVVALAAGLYATGFVDGALVEAGTFAAVAYVCMRVPITGVVRVDKRVELATDRSPDAVRRDLLGPDSPLFYLDYRRADGVESDEEGRTDRLVVDGDRVTYEALDRGDGRVEVRIRRGGTLFATVDVGVESRGDRTVLDADVRREGRVSPLDLATDPVRARYERRALDALGYEVVGIRSRTRL